MKFLLDSTLLIDHLNGVDEAEAFLAEHASDSAITVITVNEVLTGSGADQVAAHEVILDQFTCFGIDYIAAKTAAALRKEHHWKLADSFQAALALRHGLKLVTRNTKDFKTGKHGFVHVPYTL